MREEKKDPDWVNLVFLLTILPVKRRPVHPATGLPTQTLESHRAIYAVHLEPSIVKNC